MPRRLRFPHVIFDLVLLICLFFVFATTLAMALYAGGTSLDPHARGYSFAANFLSDLGRAQARNGSSNLLPALLFKLALLGAGLALGLFFVAFARLFWRGLVLRILVLFGSALGLLTALCFVGVGLIPSDADSPRHGFYAAWAFKSFLGASLFYSLAIASQRHYPRAAAWVFVAFTLALAAYVALITRGPIPNSPHGLLIQALGQKLIVYASIIAVGTQSLLARRFLSRSDFSRFG